MLSSLLGPPTLKHGGHLLLHPGGERHAGQDVAGRHRARHEPGVSQDTRDTILYCRTRCITEILKVKNIEYYTSPQSKVKLRRTEQEFSDLI